jgi:hypothetical protein
VRHLVACSWPLEALPVADTARAPSSTRSHPITPHSTSPTLTCGPRAWPRRGPHRRKRQRGTCSLLVARAGRRVRHDKAPSRYKISAPAACRATLASLNAARPNGSTIDCSLRRRIEQSQFTTAPPLTSRSVAFPCHTGPWCGAPGLAVVPGVTGARHHRSLTATATIREATRTPTRRQPPSSCDHLCSRSVAFPTLSRARAHAPHPRTHSRRRRRCRRCRSTPAGGRLSSSSRAWTCAAPRGTRPRRSRRPSPRWRAKVRRQQLRRRGTRARGASRGTPSSATTTTTTPRSRATSARAAAATGPRAAPSATFPSAAARGRSRPPRPRPTRPPPSPRGRTRSAASRRPRPRPPPLPSPHRPPTPARQRPPPRPTLPS